MVKNKSIDLDLTYNLEYKIVPRLHISNNNHYTTKYVNMRDCLGLRIPKQLFIGNVETRETVTAEVIVNFIVCDIGNMKTHC